MATADSDTSASGSISSRIRRFFGREIWCLQREQVSGLHWGLLKLLRVVLLTARGFLQDLCTLRASALTFYTLLSIVPILALAFGIAKGFGFEQRLQEQLLREFSAQQEVMTRIFGFARTLLETTKGGLIAGIGLVMLFWSVVKVLHNIEESFNVIWKVRRARTLARKFADYLAIMFTTPVLMLVSGSLTVFITTHVSQAAENMAVLNMLSPVIGLLLKLVTYALIWIMFSMLYFIMPNCRVSLSGGLLAGLLAGSLFQVVQWAYINFQVLIAKYNAIYGGFAALPLFLIWLHLSWLIVLMGAEFASAWQRVDSSDLQWENARPSARARRLMALAIVHLIVRRFAEGKPALTGIQIARRLQLPAGYTLDLLERMVHGGLLSRVQLDDEEREAYQPAADIGRYTVQYVLQACENHGDQDLPALKQENFRRLSEVLEEMEAVLHTCPANRLLKDIAF